MTSTRQLTIRHDSPSLSKRLKALAKSRGESVNATVLFILKQAVEVEARRDQLLADATWTDAEAKQFDDVLREIRVVDAKMWR